MCTIEAIAKKNWVAAKNDKEIFDVPFPEKEEVRRWVV